MSQPIEIKNSEPLHQVFTGEASNTKTSNKFTTLVLNNDNSVFSLITERKNSLKDLLYYIRELYHNNGFVSLFTLLHFSKFLDLYINMDLELLFSEFSNSGLNDEEMNRFWASLFDCLLISPLFTNYPIVFENKTEYKIVKPSIDRINHFYKKTIKIYKTALQLGINKINIVDKILTREFYPVQENILKDKECLNILIYDNLNHPKIYNRTSVNSRTRIFTRIIFEHYKLQIKFFDNYIGSDDNKYEKEEKLKVSHHVNSINRELVYIGHNLYNYFPRELSNLIVDYFSVCEMLNRFILK